MTEERNPETLDDEGLAELERRVRDGLGPESGLVDVLKNGEAVRAFCNTPAGRAIVEECARRATENLIELTAEGGLPSEKEREALVALRLNVGILRRMAAMVAAGNQAAAEIHSREMEAPQQ